MSDITYMFGGQPFVAPALRQPDPPEQQLRDAMVDAGLEPPDLIELDGKIHRFKSGTKGSGGHGSKPGWYIAFGDGIPAGRFGCWRAGIEQIWRAETGRELNHADQMAHARRMAEAKSLRDAEQMRKHEVAADTVELIWSGAQSALLDHPYLARKCIGVHGARSTGDGRLVVPLYSDDGALASLQYIDHEGNKLYHPGGQTGGKFWMIGTLDEPGTIYLAEGFATAATIYEVTHRPCVVAYSASNLVPVLGVLRARHGASQDIVIVADNDVSGVGKSYAEQAAAKHGARVVIPPNKGDANDYVTAGGDLASLLVPIVDNWLVQADEFASEPAPLRWLVKHWIQSNALIMVHGPSGGGKTFIVLDWALRMASGAPDWLGHKIMPASVVYLAGEGHHGLRGRIAAWKQHHRPPALLSMWLSQDGCDLNTPAGYQRVVENIRRLPTSPDLIVVDTLHRFLSGDENSAQDAKSMLDACAGLMAEFKCSVSLLHHTGVSEEAQHRARGSSAWRGALDIEISIVPGSDSRPIQIIQRKSKDAELAGECWVNLQSVSISGWLDEEGVEVGSAVVIKADAPVATKKPSKLAGHCKTFENAWWASGAEERNGNPYISRSGMLDYCRKNLGLSDASAKQHLKASVSGKPIADLILAEMIEPFEQGWQVKESAYRSAMLLRKKER
jgi:phage/plasmid primase-like uncharacterized protein